jgi:hypothetical protein
MVDYSSLDKDLNNFFVHLYNIGFVIIIPVICIIGLILNILCCIVFFSLKEKTFFYLGFKSLAECLFLIIGAISPYITCYNCVLDNTYLRMLITLITNKFLKMAVFLFITFLEIEISFNRYYLIVSHNTKTSIEKNDKIKVSIYTIICILIYVPCFFAYEIKRIIPFDNEHVLVPNEIGNNLIFTYFYSYFGLIANVTSILVLLPLNVITLIKFKKFMKNKSQNNANRTVINTLVREENNANRLVLQENAKTESRFTRMIVFISLLFVFSRLCEASVAVFVIYIQFIELIEYFKLIFSILNIFVFAFNYFIFSINFLIFYFLNNTFGKKFNLIFCCKK